MSGFRVPSDVKKHFKEFVEATDEMEEEGGEDTFTEPSTSYYNILLSLVLTKLF